MCCPPLRPARPRAYPSGLGISLEKVYLDELHRPAHGDLRVVKQPNPGLSDKEIFEKMNMGDVWLEADLLPCFRYLYFCRHTRTLSNNPYPMHGVQFKCIQMNSLIKQDSYRVGPSHGTVLQ